MTTSKSSLGKQPASRTWQRGAVGLTGAACVTAGLFALMAALIAEDFVPQDKVELAEMDINPRVEEIVVQTRTVVLDPLKPIEVPPAPPRIPAQKADKPSEPIVETDYTPDFKQPRIVPATFNVVQGPRDVAPLFRVPPQMPARATRSGSCEVKIDVAANGEVLRAETLSCTEAIFKRPTLRAVAQWRYRPKVENGQGVVQRGLRTTVTFRLADEQGNIIQ